MVLALMHLSDPMADEQVTWIPARGYTVTRFGVVAIAVIGMGAALTFTLLAFPLGVFTPGELATILAGNAVLLLALGLVFYSTGEARIGLSSRGVQVVQLGRSRFVPWDSIQPALLLVRSRGELFIYFRAEGSKWPGTTILTNEQGRALLTHPAAPGWPAPRDICEKWGLPPYTRD